MPASINPGSGQSDLGLLLPALVLGLPLALIAAIVIAQVAFGVAWLPVVRRWRNRDVAPAFGQRFRQVRGRADPASTVGGAADAASPSPDAVSSS